MPDPRPSESEVCGRLLVGQGTDTWDPTCQKPLAHEGVCEPDLLARRLAWERAHPRPEALRHAERMIVQGLEAYGFGRQYQVTRNDGFEIAVDDLLIRVEHRPEGTDANA